MPEYNVYALTFAQRHLGVVHAESADAAAEMVAVEAPSLCHACARKWEFGDIEPMAQSLDGDDETVPESTRIAVTEARKVIIEWLRENGGEGFADELDRGIDLQPIDDDGPIMYQLRVGHLHVRYYLDRGFPILTSVRDEHGASVDADHSHLIDEIRSRHESETEDMRAEWFADCKEADAL